MEHGLKRFKSTKKFKVSLAIIGVPSVRAVPSSGFNRIHLGFVNSASGRGQKGLVFQKISEGCVEGLDNPMLR